MTALAVVGSATSTSLTSRGRSTTTDFPMPSGTNRELASLLTRRMMGATASAASMRVGAVIQDAATTAANKAVRVCVRCAIVVSLIGSLSNGCHGGDAKADQVDVAPRVLCVIGDDLFDDLFAFEIHDAAKRQDELSHELGTCQRFSLGGRNFDRCGSADDNALTVLFFDRLVDCQHPQIGEDCRTGENFGAGIPFATRQNDV